MGLEKVCYSVSGNLNTLSMFNAQLTEVCTRRIQDLPARWSLGRAGLQLDMPRQN